MHRCCDTVHAWWHADGEAGPGGASRDRTGDPLLAKQVLSQLSYGPSVRSPEMVGLGRFELPASPLSGVRSDQLSYRPGFRAAPENVRDAGDQSSFACTETGNLSGNSRKKFLALRLLKEVIQPHVPVRLPCYDFTPVIEHTVVSALLAVRLPTSGAVNFHGVTGGVYKTRERIHRSNADLRLLAIPTSRSRVADSDPDYDRLYGIGSTSRLSCPLYRPL